MSPDATTSRRPPPPIPVSVLTGFLGSGKTTLLNRLLRDPALADTLVLINEFGDIGLDHLLVEGVEGDTVLMASGCLCCTIRGDLVTRLEEVTRRRDNHRIRPFGRILIETTGLADPAPVLHTILAHPYLVLRYRLDGVITVVDAVNGAATLDAHEEAVKQVAVADRIVISKGDLAADPAKVAALRARLSALNPGAHVLASADATAGALLDAGPFDPARKGTDVQDWLAAEAVEAASRHGHHHHDVNRHDARIRAFSLRADGAVSSRAFDLFLELVQATAGPNLLRLKGLLKLADDPSRPVVLHAVQNILHPPLRLERWPDEDTSTRLVFIMRDTDPATITRLWDAFAGPAAPDRPDPAVLVDNPLAPVAGGLFA